MPTIIIADDHPFTLMGTRGFVEGLGYKIIDVFSSGIAACNGILSRCPDVALLDMSMPGMNGIEILEKLGKSKCATRVVLLTMHNEVSIFNRARELGVKGYVLKEFATKELATCLAEVMAGRSWFSPELSGLLQQDSTGAQSPGLDTLTFSERKILQLIAAQHTTKTIAQMLFVSDKTVENHRGAIMKKLALPPEKNALLIWAMKNMTEGGQGGS
jgi:DNA-binding NarL/FixJ family response regulator